MPRQSPPYRPLTEVVADQHVFELADVAGTMLGFRFPAYAEGIEVGGYHLHFISDDRRRGGQSSAPARVACGRASIPRRPPRRAAAAGSDLADPDLAAETHAALDGPRAAKASGVLSAE